MTDPLPKPEPVRITEPNAVVLVLTNAPDQAIAERIAAALVDERLAACVNIQSPCRSVYRWQGKVETATEVPLLIKTAQDRLNRLVARLTELHPHQVPEILFCRPDGGAQPYLNWVLRETRPRPAARRL